MQGATRLQKLAGKSSLFDGPAAEIGEISAATRDSTQRSALCIHISAAPCLWQVPCVLDTK